jgi:DNA ligase-1
MSHHINSIDHQLPVAGLGPVLYKLDSIGRLRTWRMEISGSQYRTLSGLADGKQAVSGWTTATPKSQPCAESQARFEVLAQYDHQLNREYHISADTVSQPKMIEPMLAKTYDNWPGPGYAQPKLDGIRCIMTAAGMFSRQGQPITAVPHLHAAAAPLFAENPDLILDGELYNHDLRDDFGAISSVVRKKNPTADELAFAEKIMQYHVYDLVDPTLAFDIRQERYHQLLYKLDCGWLIPVSTSFCSSRDGADEHYAAHIGQGYEGGIYRLDKPYEIGRRSKFLLKRKEFITREYTLLRLEEGNGNWAGAVKRAVLQNDDGSEFGAGLRGSYDKLKKLLGAEIGPRAQVTLRYFQLTPDGVPRFPVVIDIHLDGRKD